MYEENCYIYCTHTTFTTAESLTRAQWLSPPRNCTIAVKKGRDIEGRTARCRFKFRYV